MQQVLDYKWVQVPICWFFHPCLYMCFSNFPCKADFKSRAKTTMALYQAMRATPDHLPKERPKWKDLWKAYDFGRICDIFLRYPPWNWQFAPEIWWLEDYFSLGRPNFRCELLVSGRVRHQIHVVANTSMYCCFFQAASSSQLKFRSWNHRFLPWERLGDSRTKMRS